MVTSINFARADELLAEVESAAAYLRSEWRFNGVRDCAEYADFKARIYDVVALVQSVPVQIVQEIAA